MRFLLKPKRISSFLLVPSLIIGMLSIQGCPVPTGVPAIDIANFGAGVLLGGFAQWSSEEPEAGVQCNLNAGDFLESDKSKGMLRQGEHILLENRWPEPSTGFLIITDERVINSDPMHQCVMVELAYVKRTRQVNCGDGCVGLEMYGWRFVSITTPDKNNKDVFEVIDAQIEYIDSIRDDLGIVIPAADVSSAELDRLNAPVIAELRRRRSN